MNKNPIIVIDDDEEDLEFILQAFAELNIENEIIVFKEGRKFLEYIKVTAGGTFFILCDINMPRLTGIELKKIVYDDERFRMRCIPFIFFSTSGGSSEIMKAYRYGVQGYFIKPSDLTKWKDLVQSMIVHWRQSQQGL